MLKIDHKQSTITGALGLDNRKDEELLDGMINILKGNTNKNVSWCMQRVWIDERLNDNQRCFLIFMLGRMYQIQKPEREDE